jgi:soluble lytic murein transglycosylase-like protein
MPLDTPKFGFSIAKVFFALAVFFLLSGAATTARADYAVLRSGTRLHITGYEVNGDRVRLSVSGGSVQIAANDLLAVEREELFRALPQTAAPLDVRYASLIHAAATKHGVDEHLVAAVIAAESNFNTRAVSRKRALGLMQLLPETAARYAVRNVFDPEQNIEGGVHYLKDLLARYKNNVALALAAYNAGPEAVDRYGGLPPFPETRNYVREITTKLAHEAPIAAAASLDPAAPHNSGP